MFTGQHSDIDIGDSLLADGSVEISVFENDARASEYITRRDAEEIVNHLRRLFDLL